MKIALAQISSLPGDLDANLSKHRRSVELAIAQGVGLILFPELSLTGYEPTLAAGLAMTTDDPRLEVFQQLSDQNKVTMAVGAPIRTDSLPQIGLILFRPGERRRVYYKQYLHPDELPYFTAGRNASVGIYAPLPAALAICYEIALADHLDAAARCDAACYLASVAKFLSGIEAAHERLAFIAGQLQIPVLMANAVGEADGGRCAGRSAVWDKNGRMIRQLNETEEGLLVYDTVSGTAWKSNLTKG